MTAGERSSLSRPVKEYPIASGFFAPMCLRKAICQREGFQNPLPRAHSQKSVGDGSTVEPPTTHTPIPPKTHIPQQVIGRSNPELFLVISFGLLLVSLRTHMPLDLSQGVWVMRGSTVIAPRLGFFVGFGTKRRTDWLFLIKGIYSILKRVSLYWN